MCHFRSCSCESCQYCWRFQFLAFKLHTARFAQCKNSKSFNFYLYILKNSCSTNMLRRRKIAIQSVSDLDAFPKVSDTYIIKTTTGGTSIINIEYIEVLIKVTNKFHFLSSFSLLCGHYLSPCDFRNKGLFRCRRQIPFYP